MPYLVDGHNLIPKLGLRLEEMDDEQELLVRLEGFCRLRHVEVEVYFDGAPPGWAHSRKRGNVTAHFISQGSSADAAIETRLDSLGRQARNWTVISSDGRVRAAARAVHSPVRSSEEFAQEMVRALSIPQPTPSGDSPLSPDELEEWLRIFDRKKG